MTAGFRRLRLSAAAVAGAAAVACSPSEPPIKTVEGVAQGTTYSLQWTGGADVREIAAAAQIELERIDALLSNYRSDSTLERFNATQSVEPIELPAELVALLALAKRVHGASDGCFDPTVRPLVRAWGFDADSPAVPSADAIEAARATVGLDKLELLDATHVRKGVPGLEIDMASIGQGYTAGQLGALLERHGSTAYLAEIGGEVVARGAKPDGAPWRVGIERPVDDTGAAPALRMPEARSAVITSGSYRHYLEADDRFFGHIIDPRTGRAIEHSLLSVTVVGEDAASAAAWATALLCLGPRDASVTAERENLATLQWILQADGAAPAPTQSSAFQARWAAQLDLPGTR